MVAESLSLLLTKVVDCSLIHGFRVGNSPLQIHHLQFVDDTIIFCEATEESAMNLLSLLRWFELSSSLSINYQKSEIFDINLSDRELGIFSNILRCVSSSLPSTYLGLPLCIGSPGFSQWESIIHKFSKRLASWKGKYLSFAGRITLLRAIFSALPVYFLSAFKCPSKVVLTLE